MSETSPTYNIAKPPAEGGHLGHLEVQLSFDLQTIKTLEGEINRLHRALARAESAITDYKLLHSQSLDDVLELKLLLRQASIHLNGSEAAIDLFNKKINGG